MKLVKLLFLIVATTTTMSGQYKEINYKDQFIKDNYIFCKWIEQEYSVPFAVSMAICIEESGWGKSYAYKHCNNPFGIRDSKDKAIQFKGKKEAFEYFAKLLTQTKRYSPVRYCTGYRIYCILLQDCGYNTSPSWAGRLIRIILDNKLDKY